MIMFSECQFYVFQSEGIPAISVHESDGSFYNESGLQFDESLERRVMLFFEVVFKPLRVYDMMYEIGVGK